MTRKKLAALLGCKEPELKSTLDTLAQRLLGSESEVSLAVDAGAAEAGQKAFERELGRDIGEAGLEVLAIVLYRGPSTRAQIDYIRGVNTASTLRTLLTRGLVERTGNPEDAREYLYRPTVELLAHLGVAQARELPDHDTIARELAAFEQTKEIISEDHADITN